MDVKQLKDKDGNDFEPNAPAKVTYLRDYTSESITVDTEYRATENGWVSIRAIAKNGAIKVYVDGAPRFAMSVTSGEIWFIEQYPVANGQTYKITKSDDSTIQSAAFAYMGGGALEKLSTFLRNLSKPFTQFSTGRYAYDIN